MVGRGSAWAPAVASWGCGQEEGPRGGSSGGERGAFTRGPRHPLTARAMRYSPRKPTAGAWPEPSPDRRSAGRLDAISSLTRGKLRACVQLGTRWQPLSTPPTLWAWVGVGMGWGAGAMFGYDSLWPYNARARLCAPPTATAASWGDRRSAALAASPARAASNAPRHALLRPHGEPPAAAECRPIRGQRMTRRRRYPWVPH